jgi:hypothetical protein
MPHDGCLLKLRAAGSAQNVQRSFTTALVFAIRIYSRLYLGKYALGPRHRLRGTESNSGRSHEFHLALLPQQGGVNAPFPSMHAPE